MSNASPFYKNVTPVNKVRHANWSIVGSDRFDFAKNIHSVPLTAVEFPSASHDFAIVFAKNNDGVLPIAVMGVRAGENLFVGQDGKWKTDYIPAFVRRYPFVFSTSDEGKTLTLCLDESFEGARQNGEGERLFTEAGENSQYLNKVVEFLQEYQNHFRRTQIFCKKLEELELLEPMGAQFKTPDGREGSLSGFFVINRDKLKKVSAEKLAELAQTDELEMIYLHLNSLNNLRKTISLAGAPQAVANA
jgi:hypothetical protein